MAAAGPASWCREMKLPSFAPENAAGTPGWLTRKVCISETRRHPRVHHDAPRRDCLGCTGDEREGPLSLRPSLARGIKPRCRPLTATLPTRTPPGDIVRSQVLSSRAPRVLLADAAGPRGSGRWCRRCRTSPSHFGGATLLSFPGAETRGDGNNRRRKGYARDTRMMSLTTTRIPAAERHLRLPRTLPGRAVRTPGPPPRA